MKTKGSKNHNKAKVEVVHRGATYTICQREDGVHIHQRYSREDERLVTFSELLSPPENNHNGHVVNQLNGKAVMLNLSNPDHKRAVMLECNMAAADLDAISAAADELKFGIARGPSQLDAGHVHDACEQIRKVYRMLKGIIVPPAPTGKELSARYGHLKTEVYAPEPIR